MADIKTHLRELSVGVAIGMLKSEENVDLRKMYSPHSFFDQARKIIKNDISAAENINRLASFTDEHIAIISNGIMLARSIVSNPIFHISDSPSITWDGSDTQKEDPADIHVGEYGFSLKENSFILENMGLYKLLNCYTGSSYEKRHIFKDYAEKEYKWWFNVAWAEMIRFLNANNNEWHYYDANKNKTSSIIRKGSNVELAASYGLETRNVLIPVNCNLEMYEAYTTPDIREQVFSRFINENLQNNDAYILAKKHCAETASNALAKELNENLDYHAGLPRFLRIHEEEYYYAKTTQKGVEIYKVPSLRNFQEEIEIESIVGSVPDTQANILTTIKNKITGERLVLRNECRFSHGQFNGTPEAKMYYERGGSLEIIYQKI